MSQLLRRIDAELQVERMPTKRGELLARRACHLARLGQFIEARELIEQTRDAFPTDSHPHVSIWMMLAEGVLYTFEDLSAQGRDRVMRPRCSLLQPETELLSRGRPHGMHIYFQSAPISRAWDGH